MQGKSVSVILPVYNGENTIERAVSSALSQTYTEFELIIINDGSTDKTPEILSCFEDRRIKIFHQLNRGKVASLNRGLQESNCKYVAFLDADDMMLPERLEKQVNFLERHPSISVVGTATREVYKDGTEKIRYRPKDTKAIKKNIVRICPFTHSSTMIRKEVFDKTGFYDPAKDGPKRLAIGEDYDLWIRLLAAGYEMANLSDVLTIYYREAGSSIRGRPLALRIRQRISARIDVIKKLGLPHSAYLNLIPVVFCSILDHYGVRLDGLFNLFSGASDLKTK
jgi:glycosyltransferase involved in cell wall biosynthesis